MRRWSLASEASRFAREQEAASATEYAILLALLVLVAVATIQSIGTGMYAIYENINAVMPDP
jgi:Flp pilus assembly pilin Flp